ncbi:MAG: hypothetical protein V4574_10900 [Pseudomonadota bacterium]
MHTVSFRYGRFLEIEMHWLAYGLGLIMLAGAAMVIRRWWLGLGRTARTLKRIAPALVELDEFFALIDLAGPGSHYLERHGPMLMSSEVLRRAETGMLEVSGVVGKPVASSRWLHHADLLECAVSALEHWAAGGRPAGGRFRFEFDREVGEGFRKGGGTLVRTRIAVVIVRDGEIVTAFPSLEGK